VARANPPRSASAVQLKWTLLLKHPLLLWLLLLFRRKLLPLLLLLLLCLR